MQIKFDEQNKIFQINTPNTTYMMGLFDEKYLCHLYYGQRMEDTRCRYLLRKNDSKEAAHALKRGKMDYFYSLFFEYPASGTGDFRDNCLCVRTERGHRVCELCYDSHRIFDGKPKLTGMPMTFASENAPAQTLEITLKDELLGLKIILYYSIFKDSDAIIRSVVAVNEGTEKLYLERILSACLELDNEEYELTTLHGAWGRERCIKRRPITEGKFIIDSIAGKTDHMGHPFLMVTDKHATQKHGNVYAMHFIYSGNYIAEAELSFQDSLRMTIGIHPEGFEWVLEPGQCFETPEAVLLYSAQGIGKMTRSFHELYKNHLIRSKYLHQKRPILINNWEATYFDFNSDKLVAIAKDAKKLGIEMLVMDDGWFGKRNHDECALGDWYPNEEKLKGNIKTLAERINAEGLKFGIWFEPEMISPDSELYRKHPDWAIQVPGREIAMHRMQYVLDITRPEVREHVYGCIADILKSANISYVKWDMNRALCDIGSYALDKEHMGEFFHRYVLGLYEMQERLIQDFPDLLLENCCGGGGRFDPGMLYYSPQIWTSDDMDPIERLKIQEGTALIYPLSTMGAHICVSPTHTTGRNVPLKTRAYVAMCGTFGYELDITKMSEKEKAQVIRFNEEYHKYNEIFREGDYYRIASYRENHIYDCWEVVSKDKSEVVVTYVQAQFTINWKNACLKLEGLDEDADYLLEDSGEVYSGKLLMCAGYLQRALFGDYDSRLLHFKKI